MGVRVSNQSNWCMGRIKEKKRVAAASRGQVHLNTLGIDAAIKAYRTAVLDSERDAGKDPGIDPYGGFLPGGLPG